MSHKHILFFLLFMSISYSQGLSFDQAKEVLLNIKNNPKPDNKIIGPSITIIDDNLITATIKCDSLIQKDTRPTILIGNVVAIFYDNEVYTDENMNGIFDKGEMFIDENGNNKYDDRQPISKLRSDIAYYQKNFSLKAEKNVTIKNGGKSPDQ